MLEKKARWSYSGSADYHKEKLEKCKDKMKQETSQKSKKL